MTRAAGIIRDFEAGDAAQLLSLMRALARFEDYIDAFAVTEADLLAHGLGDDALFRAFVAEDESGLVGMAVTYVIPWTYTRHPGWCSRNSTSPSAGAGMGRGAG